MFRRLFATTVSLAWALSLLLVGFKATAAPLQDSFTPLDKAKPLPAAVLVSPKGQQRTLAELVKEGTAKGPVLLHLWATRCAPCQPEMRDLTEAVPTLKDKGITVLAVAQEADGLVAVPAFLRRYSLREEGIYVDPNLALAHAILTDGLPSTFLINATGQIAGMHIGPLDWAALAR